MERLPAQHLRPRDFEGVESQLISIFKATLFAPILRLLNKEGQKVELHNAKGDALRAALKAGRVVYENGVFSGRFSAAISGDLEDIGAKFDRLRGVYLLKASVVPSWVRAEAATYQETARNLHERITKELNRIEAGIGEERAEADVNAMGAVNNVEQGFRETARKLSIPPMLTPDSKAALAKNYSQNMNLWVRKFNKDMIGQLRKDVQENAEAGFRFDRLSSKIKNRWGVTESKAKFLARQETALFMTNYRKERLGEAGVTQYRWETAHDEDVRLGHRPLNGKIFSYGDPPIVDPRTGRRGNPGQDYNCRCLDIPVVGDLGKVAMYA